MTETCGDDVLNNRAEQREEHVSAGRSPKGQQKKAGGFASLSRIDDVQRIEGFVQKIRDLV